MHIHGTGIDVSAVNNVPASATALWAKNGATIHAKETAYNLISGIGGTVTRIIYQDGHIHAPDNWEHIPNPTTIPNYTSVTRADTTIIASGTSGGHPHSAIYDTSRPSKWFDTVDKTCTP